MATISGFLRFDKTRSAISSDALPGLANIPIILQNTATNETLAVATDTAGKYVFNNVPNGNYRIVEAYGTPATASPGDYKTAVAGNPAAAVFPPISAASDPPKDATHLDGVTPTTLSVTVADADLSNQDILNGPVRYEPIQALLDTGMVISPNNLITEADKGTFGAFPQGTRANTGVQPNPYPGMGSQFTYTQPNPVGVTPGGGHYTIQNILNDATAAVQNTWWRVADHTTGNETGRMLVINGDNPGKILFQQQVTVKPDTYYLMSSWILNLSKSKDLVDPQLGVQVLDMNGQTIYNATLGVLIPMQPDNPEWKQIGTVINSQGNTTLTLRFISMGPEVVGNDYAIDDIALNEVQITAYTPTKSADTAVAYVDGIVTYTVTLTNTGSNPLLAVRIQDAMPDGMKFIPGSVTVNGASNPDADPTAGFLAPNVPGGKTLTVTFQARADHVPPTNPVANRVKATYFYTPVTGGIPDFFSKTSDKVDVTVRAALADLAITKTSNQTAALAGTMLTYMLTMTNNGPSIARDVTVTDQTPADFLSPEYSADGGTTWQPWHGSYALSPLSPGAVVILLIRGTVSPAATGSLANTAVISSSTPDPNPDNNHAKTDTPIHTCADLSVTKTAEPTPVRPGHVLTYTLTAANSGPNIARDVTLTDQTPDLLSPEYSADGGVTWQPWNGTYALGTLAVKATATVLIRATVNPAAYGSLANTATVSSATQDPNPDNNSAAIKTPVNTSADLSVTKTANQNPVQAGSALTYTLTATNSGPDIARDVTITDQTPGDLLSPEYSADGGAVWQSWQGAYTLSSLAPGAAAVLLIRGTVSPASVGNLFNTAAVNSETPDPNPGNNSATIETPVAATADLSVTKTADQGTAQAGKTLTYAVVVTNNGPNSARDVTVTDAVPGNLRSPEYSADGGVTWQPWSGTHTVSTLAAGAVMTIFIRGTIDAAAIGSLTNTAIVNSGTPDPNPDNNSATIETPVTAFADLCIEKKVCPIIVKPCDTIIYTIKIFNRGMIRAEKVVVRDILPKEIRDAFYSTDCGDSWAPWRGCEKFGRLAAGACLTVLIRGVVSRCPQSVIVNCASVCAANTDPNTCQNYAEATVCVRRGYCSR